MRVLLVSYRFPPYNSMGAVSVGKTAKFLLEAGIDVRVLSARDQPLQANLELEVPRHLVTYTRWVEIARPLGALFGGRKRVADAGWSSDSRLTNYARHLATLIRDTVVVPDPQVGWIPFAVAGGVRLLRAEPTDLVLASAPPNSSAVVGAILARKFSTPLVVQLRDLWADNPYYIRGRMRLALEQLLERRTLRHATALVLTTPSATEHLANRYACEVTCVMNGFDPADVDLARTAEPVAGLHIPAADTLRLVHTGSLIDSRRDPTPLFVAMRQLADRGINVECTFVGRYAQFVRAIASAVGVQERVRTIDNTSHAEAVASQAAADCLLILQWDHPSERFFAPGKLFEYLAAGRPLLAVGPRGGIVDEVVRGRRLGVVSRDISEIATFLEQLAVSKAAGAPSRFDPAIVADLSKQSQTAALVGVLRRAIDAQA